MDKKQHLIDIISRLDSIAVAFSGGVDSSFLLAVCHEVLGDKVLAITADAAIHLDWEIALAKKFTTNQNIRHILFHPAIMEQPEFIINNQERCYICKKFLFQELKIIATKNSIKYIVHGANKDDLEDFRPGFKAASELGVLAPLITAGFSKAEIREEAKKMGLDCWDRPAMACLATRIPYGTSISYEALKIIEQAETVLYKMGVKSCRVRHHGNIAGIEIDPAIFPQIIENQNREIIINELKALGYKYVTLDLDGYTQGSLNRAL